MNSRWVKFSVGAGILLIGAGVFYNLVIFTPNIKQQEVNEKKRIQEDKNYKEARENIDRAICKSEAEQSAISMFKDRKKEYPGMYTSTFGDNTFLTDDYQSSLKRCLQGCGLEK